MTGGSSHSALAGAQAGKNAVENNALSDIAENKASGISKQEKYQKAQDALVKVTEEFKAQNCAGMSAEACGAKMDAHRDELLRGAGLAGLDFVPVVGDIMSFAEAQSALDYLAAVIGIIPGAGDVVEASRLINKASDEVSAYNAAAYPKLKDDLMQQNLNNIAKQDPRLDAVVRGDNGKLNYGIGSGSRDEADRLGKI
uniref:VENN motif pre-toxin domain-containing protein n=1 Tax=Pantoea dispersa TaxID=59814 RepID=UPI00215C909D|nr:VENN motif pre-toxin domain-containing protein [Pantoea dispersa]